MIILFAVYLYLSKMFDSNCLFVKYYRGSEKNDNFWVFLTLKWSKIYENNIRSELEVVFLWFLTIWENIR